MIILAIALAIRVFGTPAVVPLAMIYIDCISAAQARQATCAVPPVLCAKLLWIFHVSIVMAIFVVFRVGELARFAVLSLPAHGSNLLVVANDTLTHRIGRAALLALCHGQTLPC